MPKTYRLGESIKFHPRRSDPEGHYAQTMAGQIQKKLELLPPPQPVTTLKQMSPEKQAEMARLYPPPTTQERHRPIYLRAPAIRSDFADGGQRPHDEAPYLPKSAKTLLEMP